MPVVANQAGRSAARPHRSRRAANDVAADLRRCHVPRSAMRCRSRGVAPCPRPPPAGRCARAVVWSQLMPVAQRDERHAQAAPGDDRSRGARGTARDAGLTQEFPQSRCSPGVPRCMPARRRNRSTDATRGHRLPSADPGGSLRDAAGDADPWVRSSSCPSPVTRSICRPARTGVRWRRGGSSQPRGEDAPRHAPRKLSSGNYERVTNRAAINTSDSWTPGQAIFGTRRWLMASSNSLTSAASAPASWVSAGRSVAAGARVCWIAARPS
jgi:hypothetical protein